MIHLHVAAAGGGSSGFGGGGGGGGRGAALYFLLQILIRIAIFGHGIGVLVLIGLIILAILFTRVSPGVRAFWSARQDQGPAERRRAARRERRTQLAAAEAAEDDPAFAPDAVKHAAGRLFVEIQAAWSAGDRQRLAQLVAPDLLAEWSRRLSDFERRGWHNQVEPLGDPRVEYVGLTRGPQSGSGRVVVRIEARVRDYVKDAHGNRIRRSGGIGDTVLLREYWTLARNDSSGWVLASVEHGGEGRHALEEQLVATPWSDEQGLRDEALVEQAVGETLPEGMSTAEVADLQFTGGARAAALDLSLVDGRFAPDVLEVAARRAVAAWAQAVDGSDAALHDVAGEEAARSMLYPTAGARLVVRGPKLRELRITNLDPAADPPTMTVEVDVEGRRYLEDRDTAAILAGSRSQQVRFTEHWTLALDGDSRQPWRIVAVGAPALRL